MKKIHSKITDKLLHRFFLIYTCVFLVLILLILTVSGAMLFYDVRSSASSGVSLMSDSLYDYRKNIHEKSYFLMASEQLKALVRLYDSSPSKENYERINLYLNSFQSADSSLLYLMMEDENGHLFHSINYHAAGIYEFIRSQAAYQASLNQNISYLSPVLTEESYIGSPCCFYITSHFLEGHSFTVTLCYDALSLLQDINRARQNLDEVKLYNSRRECIYDSADPENRTSFPEYILESTTPTGSFMDINGYHYYQIDYAASFYTTGTVHLSVLLGKLGFLFLLLCAVYLIPLAVVFTYIIPVNDRLLRPIKELTDEIQGFSLGQRPVGIYVTGDEIEDLSRSFAQMTVNINRQANELSLKEREKSATYYKLLTTQLDPHFIYNTMNIINILARNQAFEDIVKVNTALTRVLRERLNTQNTTFEEIQNEIQTLKQYQVIMDYRYHNQVQVEYDVDPSILTNKIPKNILQPLVENSYYHGLSRDDGVIFGTISVMIYALDEEIVIEISDDGRGLTWEQLERVRENLRTASVHPEEDAHIGMENIYRRIQYLYQDHFSMDIQGQPDNGATVVITLPLAPPD